MQDYVEAVPEWTRNIGQRLDDLFVHPVPAVHQAVTWNQPFNGFKDEGWFPSFRCSTNDVQVQFVKGSSLDAVNCGPGSSRPASCPARGCHRPAGRA